MPTVRTQDAIKQGHRRLAGGFTLVELLLVVMVIMIIAAIAIPNMVHGKMRANEAAAVASVRAINTAETLYNSSYPDVGYSNSLTTLGSNGSDCTRPTSSNSCLIMDEALTSGLKSGYVFEILGDGNKPSLGYQVNATPESGVSGHCSIGSNQGGELTFSAPGGSSNGGKSIGSGGGGCDL